MDEYLFENERVVTQSGNGVITLTTHRIRYYSKSLSRAHLIGIMLNKISSISLKHRSKPLYLILAIISFATTAWLVYSEGDDSFIIPAAVGLAFLVVFILSRKAAIAIASQGGDTIYFHTLGMKRSQQLHFINQVETAIENHRQLNKAI